MTRETAQSVYRIFTASIIAVCAVIFALGGAAYAEDQVKSVKIRVNNSDITVPVRAIQRGGSHYLFLPSSTTDANLSFEEGDSIDNYSVMTDQNIGSLHFFSEDPVNYGRSYIEGSKDHSTKAPGRVVLLDQYLNVEYQGRVEAIKGRGNTTWRREKKPYQIKLSKKTNLLDPNSQEQKAKKWILLANALDNTLLRNQIAFSLAREMGLETTPEGQQVDLYYDGEYRGTYYLCEKVEIGEGRVEINDLDKHPEVLTGGYLLEIDNAYFGAEPVFFLTSSAGAIVVKSPEEITDEQLIFIRVFVTEAMNCVKNGGRNEKGEFVLFDYFDREAIVKYFLVMECLRNGDAYGTSAFFYKPEDENKLYFGPVWDFDHSMGYRGLYADPEGWVLSGLACYLIKIPEFRAAVRETYQREMQHLMRDILLGETEGVDLKTLDNYSSETEKTAIMNCTALERGNKQSEMQYKNEISAVRHWLDRRIQWLDVTIMSEDFLSESYDPTADKVDSSERTTNQQKTAEQNKTESILVPGRPRVKAKAGRRRFRLSWNKVARASGYQVRYRVSDKNKPVKVKKVAGRSLFVRKLKKRTKYKIKVRAYTQIGEKKYYGKWSREISVKVR